MKVAVGRKLMVTSAVGLLGAALIVTHASAQTGQGRAGGQGGAGIQAGAGSQGGAGFQGGAARADFGARAQAQPRVRANVSGNIRTGGSNVNRVAVGGSNWSGGSWDGGRRHAGWRGRSYGPSVSIGFGGGYADPYYAYGYSAPYASVGFGGWGGYSDPYYAYGASGCTCPSYRSAWGW